MKIEYNKIDQRANEIVESYKSENVLKSVNFSELIDQQSAFNKSTPLAKTGDYLKACLGWVYSCVSVISDEIANIDLVLYKKTKNGLEEVNESPILDVLYKANNFTTKFDLFWLTQQYLELTGEAPWYIAKNGREITDIILLRPDLISIIPGTDKYVESYTYKIGGGKEIKFNPDEIVFLRYPDPTRAMRGKGTLQAVAKAVDIDNFSEDYNRNFFYNSALPNSVLETEQKLTKETIEGLKYQINKLYKGVDKAGKTAILEQGLTWKPLQLSPRDMEFLEQQRFSRDKILGIFRVPRTAIGITDDVNRANAEATDYVFARRTIQPKMQRLIEQLNEFFIPMFDGSENLYLGFRSPVPEDNDAKIKKYESGLKNSYMTINEVREAEGMASIGKEGDVAYMPMNLMPIGASADRNIDTNKNIIHSLNARNKDYRKLEAKKKTLEARVSEKLAPVIAEMLKKKQVDTTIKNIEVKKEVKKKEFLIEKNEVYQKFWEMKIGKQEKLEKRLRNEMAEFFSVQGKKVLKVLPSKANDLSKWEKEMAKIIDSDIAKNVKILMPIILQTIKEGGDDGYALLGTSEELDLTNPDVQKYLKKNTLKPSKEIATATKLNIGKKLAQGVEAGESITELRKRITDSYIGFSKSRAVNIARTETIRASNFGTERAYIDFGVKNKIWLTTKDDRTCPYCGPMDGKKIGVGKAFFDKGDNVTGADGNVYVADYEDIEYPPLHPQCRCTIVPDV